jgi:hypothetical protein
MKTDPKDVYAMLRRHGRNAGYKDTWADAQYRDICDDWPPWSWKSAAMLEPNDEVLDFIETVIEEFKMGVTGEAQAQAKLAMVALKKQ